MIAIWRQKTHLGRKHPVGANFRTADPDWGMNCKEQGLGIPVVKEQLRHK